MSEEILWRRRAIGPVVRWRGEPDHLMERLVCGALVVEDGEVMDRHISWHRSVQQ